MKKKEVIEEKTPLLVANPQHQKSLECYGILQTSLRNIDPNMVACGLVDHNGGKFTIGETGVSLIVPPQAIPEGDTEGIFIGIVNQEKEHPKLDDKESLLSPVVKCGPNGLKFERPVILSLPHCAQLEDGAWNLKGEQNFTLSKVFWTLKCNLGTDVATMEDKNPWNGYVQTSFHILYFSNIQM